MKRFFKKFFLHFILFGFLILLLASVFLHSKQINDIHVKLDSSMQSDPSIVQAKNKVSEYLSSYKGKKIWQVSMSKLLKEIQKIYPYGGVQIQRYITGRIDVFLKKSHIIAFILKNDHKFFPVSFSGVIQNTMSEGHHLDRPILRGDIFYHKKNIRTQACSLLEQLPKEGIFSAKNISEVLFDKNHSGFIVHLIPGHFTLEIPAQLTEQKIKNINFVIKYLLQRERFGNRINARQAKKIIVNTGA